MPTLQSLTAARGREDCVEGYFPKPGWAVDVDALTPRQWDDLAAGFADLSYDQIASGLDKRWGRKRLSHLVLRRDGIPVAGAQVVILTVPPIAKGLAYVKFGPFWRRRKEAADHDTYRAVVSALVSEYCVRRGHCLTILPRPNPHYLDLEADSLRELGFVQRRLMSDPARYLVNLTLDPADQLRSLEQKWRYNLRQAQRHDILCSISDDPAEMAAFARLHAAMESRKGFRENAAVALIPELMRRLPGPMRPQVAMARHGGMPVAGAVIGLLGDTAYYVFGATSEAALPLKAGYALQWWIVNWLTGKGVNWYDLGGKAMDPGLGQFKKGFVGKCGAILPMQREFDYWTDPLGRTVADGIYGIRAARGALRSLVSHKR